MKPPMPAAEPATALALRRILGDYARGPRAIAALPADVDPVGFARLAETLGVAPLFHRVETGPLAADVLARWRQAALEQGARNLRALAAASVFFRVLEEAGLPVAAMRGLVLAHRDYASPGERVMGDVDLLLAPESRGPALAALARAGLRPFARLRSQELFSLHGATFELHWRLLSAKRYRDCVDEAAWLARRRPWIAPEGRLYTLAPEQECLGLVLHAFAHHELGMFRQLLDIALFLCRDDLDWAAMARWCREARVSRLFGLTFALTDALFLLEAESWRGHFPSPFAGSDAAARLDPWTRPFFGGAGLADAWARGRALVHAAETPPRRLRQLLRFLSWDAARRAFRRRRGRGR